MIAHNMTADGPACALCGQPPSAQVHRIEMPSHAFRSSVAPRRLDVTPRRRFYVYDPITVSQSEDCCPRCRTLLFEDPAFGPCCLERTACGWQERYYRGTTTRADGSLITEGL